FVGEQFATSKLVKDKVTRVSVKQRRQLSLKKNDKLRVRVVCKGQVPDFANNDMGSVIPFTGDQNGPISKVKPKSISKKEKVAKPRESYACPWAMQVSKLPNEDTWEKKSDVPTTIIPPKPHQQIGRPPKKRKKSATELADEMMKSKKLTKTGKSVTCKLCKQVGHNSRGCKSKKGGGSQQVGVAGYGDAAHGSQQAGVHGSQTTQSTPQAS
ncbi:mutator type transposase, partial [Tanacetum coccineum]